MFFRHVREERFLNSTYFFPVERNVAFEFFIKLPVRNIGGFCYASLSDTANSNSAFQIGVCGLIHVINSKLHLIAVVSIEYHNKLQLSILFREENFIFLKFFS